MTIYRNHRCRRSGCASVTWLEPRRYMTGSPLTSVPQLDSNPGATSAIYLDFVGAPAQSWGTYDVPATPAFDTDGDPLTFSDAELTAIRTIWTGVAEKYSPFNINVTTVAPAELVHGRNMEIVIGGNGAWTGMATGGISYPNAYSNIFLDNISFIFPSRLGFNPAIIATGAAHEAGHEFGLLHQSLYGPGGNLINEYNPGNASIAPTMGIAYNAQRGLWWYGPNSDGAGSIQDDMVVIAAAPNVDYRPQDHGQSAATANPLSASGNVVTASGIISTTADNDFFSFATAAAGQVDLTVSVAQVGPMLHARLQLFDANGTPIATAADPATLGQRITATLPAGTYFLAVGSFGQYGDVGQYTIRGTVAPAGAITLVQSPDHLHINWGQGITSGQLLIADAAGLTLHGDGQNDPIALDYANGNPLPANLHLDGTFTINGLRGTNPLAGTALDIGQSTVYVRYADAGSNPIAAIKQYLTNGYNAGGWDGAATVSTGVITSSAARANPSHNSGIGYVDSADGTGLNPVPQTVLLKYAVLGDTDLDGSVGLSDYTTVVRNFGTGTGWDQGAVTYGPGVGLMDYTTVVRNFGASVSPFAPAATLAASSAPQPTPEALPAESNHSRRARHARTIPSEGNRTATSGFRR